MAIISRDQRFIAAAPTSHEPVEGDNVDFARLQPRELKELSANRAPDFQIIIRQTTLDRIRAAADAKPTEEICGVLVGDVYADDIGPFVLVENVVHLESESGVGRATFSQATWRHLQTLTNKEFSNRRIVGWYYTHPGQGVTMSALDRFLHDTFFSLPWQIALAYDATKAEEGVFNGYRGSVSKSSFLIEYDDPTRRVVDALAAGGIVRRPKKKPKSGIVGKLLLALIALALFAAMGYLLGHLLLDLRSTYMPSHYHY